MASLVVAGDVSGSVTLSAPSAAGSTVITLPTTSGTMVVTGGAQTVQFAAGSAASPSITFTGDTNTGIFSPAADTIAFSEGGVESMRIDSSGNVGIGVSSPGQKLDVSTTNDIQLRLGNAATGAQFTYDIGRVAATGLLQFYGNQSGATGYIFSGVNGERMRIDSSGNVLVGTTSYSGQTSRFTVKKSGNIGTIYAEQLDSGGYNYNSRGFNNGGTYYHMQFEAGTTQVGIITSNGSNTTYGTGSDYRLKDDVARMVGALDKVQALNPVTWKWKSTGEDGQGFIAHELAEICPDAVTGKKDAVDEEGNPIYQMVDNSFLVATLTAAIQELNAKVVALEEKLNAK